MKILIIKLTSMGDILHMLPAISDLQQHFSQAEVDVLVDENFAEIPQWHPFVNRVIAVANRRWRKLQSSNLSEISAFLKLLRQKRYDIIIDAQGLLKSALLGRLVRLNKQGQRIGFSGDSIKESPAAYFYHQQIKVARQQHAITRLRELFAKGMQYDYSEEKLDYGLQSNTAKTQDNSVLFLHGTTWPSKHLPDKTWQELAELAHQDGYHIKVTWGNQQEQQRAQWLAKNNSNISIIERASLSRLKTEIQQVAGVIAVDTGLGHLAAALGKTAISIYGSTDAKLTGAIGQNQRLIQTQYPCSPCFLKQCDKLTEQRCTPPCYQTLSASEIWQQLYQKIA